MRSLRRSSDCRSWDFRRGLLGSVQGFVVVVLVSAACSPRSTSEAPAGRSAAVHGDAAEAGPGSRATRPPRAPAAPSLEPVPVTPDEIARARRVQGHVRAAAEAEGIDPNLLNGIIWMESKFNPKARSRAGAMGLMQLMPTTSKAMARALGRPNRPFDPAFNIRAGAHLLRVLLDMFEGDERLALFGYMRGSGRVRAWQSSGQPLPEGVEKFVARAQRARATFAALGFPEAPVARLHAD